MAGRRPSDDSGVTGVEYALIVGLLAVVALVGIAFVGRSLSGSFDDSTVALDAAMGVPPTATSTPTATPTSTATSTPTASPTATRTALSVSVAQLERIVVPTAEWTRVGSSGNYRWECANDYSLGRLQDVRSTSTPPGVAPDCG